MTLSIPLHHLPLRPSSLKIFQQHGFVTTGELEESKRTGGMANLAAELGVSLYEAAGLFQEVHGIMKDHNNNNTSSSSSSLLSYDEQLQPPKSAKEILATMESSHAIPRTIISFCRSIDQLLGGGIALGEVTEIAGLPGVGKTQIAMQLCVNAHIPALFGGVEGEAIYIDTEGSFSPERCFSMAQALVDHVKTSANKRHTTLPTSFAPEKILEGIHLYRVHDETAQTATIYSLPHFLEQIRNNNNGLKKQVRLVVVDSIAFHYRCAPTGKDYMERTRALSSVAASLADLAFNFNVAVVVINQMTTKFGGGTGTGTGTAGGGYSFDDIRIVPALGETWAHSITTRLLLSSASYDANSRNCELVKSPNNPSGTAFYQVVEEGIRDVPVAAPQDTQIEHNKRLRTQY